MTDERRQRVRRALTDAIAARTTPGGVVEFGTHAGAIGVESSGGLTYAHDAQPVAADSVYDLASLSKVIATTTLAMRHVSAHRLSLDAGVHAYLPDFDTVAWRGVTIADLLEHASGLPAHRSYYLSRAGRVAYLRAIREEPLTYPLRSRHEYTDLGFMLLGFVMEAVGHGSLAEQFGVFRDAALGRIALGYGVPPEWRLRVAPTEADRWRGRVLRGVVHDGNAAALGGSAGHAGLFGTAPAVGAFARWLMTVWRGHQGVSDGVSAAVVARFLTRGTVAGSSRALGWDTMLPTSSCGSHLSPAAIGHTGFTGTSLWIDPTQDLYVVLLTNRVHPAGEGTPDHIRRLRVAVHDAVAEGWPS